MENQTYTVLAESGIHARPATGLVQIASEYASELTVEYKEKKANLKSILGVMSLGIGQGASFSIHAEGTDEQEAIEAIENYLTLEGIVEL
ncbi:phosphocarrier protein HPr [Solibacillus sp. FSL H8-0523]|uniref:phosphocarrier protein HPr n=1 Tax=Solibacillus sp. FSL H8-0523 TaxID=2954511 RepID=UPI003100C59F